MWSGSIHVLRKITLINLLVALFLFSSNASYSQENISGNSGSAASSGVKSQVGVTFGGVSIVSVALAAVVITSLIAVVLEDSSTTTESVASTEQ